MRSRCAFVLLSGFAVALMLPRASAASPGSAPDELQLPHRIDFVWILTDKAGKKGKARKSGDLILTQDAVEIMSRRGEKRATIRLDSIRVLSLGKRKGDPDTDWVLLQTEKDGRLSTLGIRDGSKFGFGQQTQRIYSELKTLMIQTSSAQYRVPGGFRAYDELDSQFTLSAPADWQRSHPLLSEVDERTTYGNVVFSQPPERVREGGTALSFFVERREAIKGMRCDGIAPGVFGRLLDWSGEELLFGPDGAALDLGNPEAVEIGYCRGLRFDGEAPNGERLVLYAVSNARLVVLIGSRLPQASREEAMRTLETITNSFRFSASR